MERKVACLVQECLSVWPMRAARAQPDFQRLLGRASWDRLAPAIRRRFAIDKTRAHYIGEADVEASWIGRLIAWLVIPFGRPLPTETGHQKAEIDLLPAQGGVRWLRHYLRPNRGWETVASIKRHDKTGRLYECAGPLAMRLTVTEEAGTMVFTSDSFFLDLGFVKVRLPDCLTPGLIRVVHEDLGDDRFRFTLLCRHKLFGVTMKQVAEFTDTPLMEGPKP